MDLFCIYLFQTHLVQRAAGSHAGCRARLAHSLQGSSSWGLPAPLKQPMPTHLARALAWQPGPPGGRRLSPQMAFVGKRLHRRGPRAMAKNCPSLIIRGFA